MPISAYLANLRRHIGSALVLMPGVTAIIRDQHGHVLLQRRRDDGLWGLPGGGIEPGEAPAQAIVREVHEETGLLVRPVRVLGVFGGNERFRIRYPNGDLVDYTIVTFECAVVGGQLESRDGESLELRYFPPSEVRGHAAPEVQSICARDPGLGEALFTWDESWLEQLR